MKKIGSVLLCVALVLGVLGGCAPQEEESSLVSVSPSPSPTPEPAGPWRIGLVQYQEHSALDAIRESFMQRLEEWGCTEEQVEIQYQNAQGDPAQAGEICQGFVEDEVDMIVALATPAAQAALSAVAGTQIQVVFAGVTDPEPLGLTEGAAPESAVTGVVSPAPAGSLLDLALQADSGLQTLGVLYNPEEANALAQVEALQAACAERGITVTESTVSSSEEVQQAAGELCAAVDALYTPADSTVAPAAAAVSEAAKGAGTPWYAGSESMVQAGALAAVGVEEKETGRKAADLAAQLIRGQAVSQAPVYTFSTFRTFLNVTTLQALEGISLPQETQLNAFIYS